jgi:hypothetical protein
MYKHQCILASPGRLSATMSSVCNVERGRGKEQEEMSARLEGKPLRKSRPREED